MSAKVYTRILHKLVKKLFVEEFFVKLASVHPVFRKFVPLPADYSHHESRIVLRNATLFKVTLSDYMQWHLFADVPDIAWKLAVPYLVAGSTVLDIGSNCGHFTLKLAIHGKRKKISDISFHAFEPNPKVYDVLRDNIILNKIDPRQVITHPFALGSKNEQRFFDYSEENMGAGRVLPDSHSGKFQVSIRRLDDIVGEIKPVRIAFIKLDVEGFEPEVFKGGWDTISKYKPPVFFEVTSKWYLNNGYTVAQVLDPLRTLGYSFRIELDGSMKPYDEKLCAQLDQYNVLAIHE